MNTRKKKKKTCIMYMQFDIDLKRFLVQRNVMQIGTQQNMQF